MTFLNVLSFVGRRLLALAVMLLILSIGVFALVHVAPGSPEQLLLGARPSTPETLEAIQERYDLDEPVSTQYLLWLKGALRLDFGRSIRTGQPVTAEIESRADLTLKLALFAFMIAVALGTALGIFAAAKQRRLGDRTAVGISVVGVSSPAFATGILLLYVFAVRLEWFPVFGQGEGFVDQLWHLTLPALALALTVMAVIVKLVRAGMIEELSKDYVLFARARGIASSKIIFTHALRNALIPVVTAGGLLLGFLLTGAVLIEVTFAIPGLGLLLVDSVVAQDVPMVQALAIIFAVIIVLANLIADLLYLVIDPRIRFGAVSR